MSLLHRTGISLLALTTLAPILAAAQVSTAPTAAAAATTPVAGAYYATTPTRVLDTRTGTGAPKAKVGAGRAIRVQVAGRAGIPTSGVAAVVINVTATSPTAATFLSAYPSDSARPMASSLNVEARTNRANLVTVPLHADGHLSFFNSAGLTDIVGDVVGFYAANETVLPQVGYRSSGGYRSVTPKRIFDSRTDAAGGFVNGDTVQIPASISDLVDSRTTSLVVNINVTGATSSGYLKAWSGASNAPEPGTSAITFTPGKDIANMDIVKIASCGTCGSKTVPSFKIKPYLSGSGKVHIVVDLVGIMTNGLSDVPDYRFKAARTPTRIVDTRTKLGAATMGAGTVRVVTAPVTVSTSTTAALVTNTALIAPSTGSTLSMWKANTTWPGLPNVHAPKGAVAANGAVVELDAYHRFALRNAAGSANAVVDVAGSFEGKSATRLPTLTLRNVGAVPDRRGPLPADEAARRAVQIESLINAKINAYRTSHGARALIRDTHIDTVARTWSKHMAATLSMVHNPNPWGQMPTGWISAAENIAWMSASPRETPDQTASRFVTAWINSPHHLTNLSNKNYTHSGIGVWYASNGTWWATQDFGQYW